MYKHERIFKESETLKVQFNQNVPKEIKEIQTGRSFYPVAANRTAGLSYTCPK